MLQPKRTKFRKQQKGRNRGLAQVGNRVSFGEFGLKATTRGFVTARQIEAARRAITRYVKRGGKLWIRVFPDKPVTKKPVEVRMGKGKGNVEYWVAPIQPGRVMYEIQGVSEESAREAFRLAAAKLAVKTTFVKRSKKASELREELSGLLREKFNLRMQRGVGQLPTPHDLRRVRKDIARIRTVLNEKKKAGEVS
jgi:large subunit ribosomal protein L16